MSRWNRQGEVEAEGNVCHRLVLERKSGSVLGCTEIVLTLTTSCAPGVFSTNCSHQVEAAHLVEGDSLGEDEGDSLGEGEGNSLGLQSTGPLSRIKMAKPGLAPKRLSWDCGEYISIWGPKGR